MLQRIHDSIGRWIAGVILGLLAVAFVFWGVDYTQSGAQFAAKVNGEKIPLAEFERALRARENEFRQINRIEIDDELSRSMRRDVISQLVRSEAVLQRVLENGFRASDERLLAYVRSIPQFQAGGQFSTQVARTALANQGISLSAFEEMQRQGLAVADFETGVEGSSFVTPAEFRYYIELLGQRREIAYATFDVDAFLDDVAVDDAEIEAHYEANSESYKTPETVDLEYIELALADVAQDIEITEDDLRAYYEENRSRFETVEERLARHILFEVDDDATEEQARAAAESALARIQGGEDFAAVAAEVSDDIGTRRQGGELGWITPGMFEGAFEETLYGLETGEVAGPVRTDFGYHLIKLEDVRTAQISSFEDVRDSLETELQRNRAEDAFYDLMGDLEDGAYNAYDELESVAMETGLPLERLEGFPRTGNREVFANSEAVVQAAFGEDVLTTGRNSDLVELADDRVLVLRVAEYHPPETQPLDVVREQVREELEREKAQQLAEQAAQAFLTALAELPADGDPAALAAEHGGTWTPAAWVERSDGTVPTEVLATAFAMPRPAEGGVLREQVALAGGDYVVFALSGVEPGSPETVAEDERARGRELIAASTAQTEILAYASEVVSSAEVRVPDEVLEPQY